MARPSFIIVTFLSLALHALPSFAFFRMGAKVLLAARMDPIVSPGAVAGHEHNVVGGNKFSQVYNYEDLLTSTCTSNLVNVDFSNYWAPGLYYVNKTYNSFTYVPAYFTIYYLPRNGSKKEKVHAWPAGLRMLAGNPNRRTYNDSNVADKAVSYVCLNYSGPSPAQTYQFFKQNCPNGMRAQIVFPSCWNGKDLDSPDHMSHMAYPIDGVPDSGNCPSTHPTRLVTLFYEQVFDVGNYPYDGPGSWVLANGDDTGLGFHGDFQNGWEAPDATGNSLLQRALDQCTNDSGELKDCPVLLPYLDDAAKEACQPLNQIPDEDVGYRGNGKGGSIPKIPGCNPVWTGTGPKPTCATPAPVPTYVSPQSSLPAGWTAGKCYTDSSSAGRALKGASLVDAAGMTRTKCAAFCESKGFSLAGLEWSQECYCDNQLQNGSTVVADSQCNTACKGQPYENCGGSARITLLTKGKTIGTSIPVSSAAPTATTSVKVTSSASPVKVATTSTVKTTTASTAKPTSTSTSAKPAATTGASAWKSQGCIAEPASGRAMWGGYLSDPKMTVEKCTTFCASKGFTLAGLEYGAECWCDSALRNGASLATKATGCTSKCGGNASEICGGSWLLSVYSTSTTPKRSSSITSGAHGRRRHHKVSPAKLTF